jgi:hypothetical protein
MGQALSGRAGLSVLGDKPGNQRRAWEIKKPDNPKAPGFLLKPEFRFRNRWANYFLKPLTLLEAAGWDSCLWSLAQAPRPNATATRVIKAILFIIWYSFLYFAKPANRGFLGDESRENKHFFSVFPRL